MAGAGRSNCDRLIKSLKIIYFIVHMVVTGKDKKISKIIYELSSMKDRDGTDLLCKNHYHYFRTVNFF